MSINKNKADQEENKKQVKRKQMKVVRKKNK